MYMNYFEGHKGITFYHSPLNRLSWVCVWLALCLDINIPSNARIAYNLLYPPSFHLAYYSKFLALTFEDREGQPSPTQKKYTLFLLM